MQARVARGWSQERLAARAGISVRTVLRIEKGEAQPASATMTVLCAALGIEREVLWPDV
jgi:ribosome-binding protein aMBF1 (putative translation factor)